MENIVQLNHLPSLVYQLKQNLGLRTEFLRNRHLFDHLLSFEEREVLIEVCHEMEQPVKGSGVLKVFWA